MVCVNELSLLCLSFCSSPSSLKEVVDYIMKTKLVEEEFTFRVKRGTVLEDILEDAGSKAFDPRKQVKTSFVGEAGQDVGGVTRELWHLFGKEVQKSLCEGQQDALVLRHDSTRLKVLTSMYSLCFNNLSMSTVEW